MGTLEYVTAEHIAEIDDRTLAHLQVVICSKLRRDERFTLRLAPADRAAGPVTVLWMTSTIPVVFTFTQPTRHTLNPEWLRLLAEAAASNAGLWVIPEPAPRPTPHQPSAKRSVTRDPVAA